MSKFRIVYIISLLLACTRDAERQDSDVVLAAFRIVKEHLTHIVLNLKKGIDMPVTVCYQLLDSDVIDDKRSWYIKNLRYVFI